jgi:glycosyltransferase involved in cell wall biosynthesis
MFHSDPRVSVIIPVFNGAQFLAEAIQSVISQTFDLWELILADDGSSDHSPQIAIEYMERYPHKIRFLQHPGGGHQGTAATRNLGITHAKGEFLANLDQDDVWTKNKLEEQLGILDSHPTVAMTFGPMLLWFSWANAGKDARDKVQTFTFETNTLFRPPYFLPPLLSGRNDPHGYLIRRDAVHDVGGYVDNVGICEDWAFYAKVALKHEIFVTRNFNYCYRQHAAQACSLRREKGELYSGFTPFYDWLRAYLAENYCADRQVERAFRAAIRRNRLNHWRETAAHLARPLIGSFSRRTA